MNSSDQTRDASGQRNVANAEFADADGATLSATLGIHKFLASERTHSKGKGAKNFRLHLILLKKNPHTERRKCGEDTEQSVAFFTMSTFIRQIGDRQRDRTVAKGTQTMKHGSATSVQAH